MLSLCAMLYASSLGFSAPAATTPTGCGTATGSLVELSPTLVIGVCSGGVLRVARAPKDAKAELMARESLIVEPGYPKSVAKYTVTRQGPVTTTITTDLI